MINSKLNPFDSPDKAGSLRARMQKIILYGWVASAVALLLYSFTQVDLSLTLSQVSVWQVIQKFFQWIGYFNRPLSTALYLSIVSFMFVLYGLTIALVRKKMIDRRLLWKIIIVISLILFLSYNAFSYDLFNYIFDAKIVTHYGQNPYEHKALDYLGDPMLSFMHWTHRAFPYGPVWLFLTVPLSFIGFGYFLLTFYLFKLLMAFSFIGSVYFIEKIAKKSEINPIFAAAFFALNPLVLIESLVSAHIDIVMVFAALVALFAFLTRRYIKSFLWLILSIGIKFATVFLLPALILDLVFKVNKKNVLMAIVVSMTAAVLIATFRTNFQPWYLLLVLPFASFMSNKYFIFVPVFVISFAGLLEYVPYLYLGNWNPPIPDILNWIMVISIIASFLLSLFWKLSKR